MLRLHTIYESRHIHEKACTNDLFIDPVMFVQNIAGSGTFFLSGSVSDAVGSS